MALGMKLVKHACERMHETEVMLVRNVNKGKNNETNKAKTLKPKIYFLLS